MTEYEQMLNSADQIGLEIYEDYDFSGTRIKGLYCDGNIALSRDLRTDAEKKCILAEEIGHHETSSGNIIEINTISNRKQEHRARAYAFRLVFDLHDLIAAYKDGCRNRYEIADYLEITEEFLSEAIDYYKAQYGLFVSVDNYIIFFDPLGVLEIKT